MSYAAILSDDYAGILEVAVVHPMHSFNGREEYDFFFEEEMPKDAVIWEDGDYAIADVRYDEPTLMLFHKGKVVGFYFDMMAWLDPEHRGKGLATQLILSYAQHLGENAFSDQRKKAGCALGFSPEGYALHGRTLEVARELQEAEKLKGPVATPGR